MSIFGGRGGGGGGGGGGGKVRSDMHHFNILIKIGSSDTYHCSDLEAE